MQDVAWTVAQTFVVPGATPPSLTSAYVKAVSVDAVTTGWWNPHPSAIPDAGWITFPNNCAPGIPAQHDCLAQPGVDQWYRLEFFSCCDRLCLDLDIWADNRVQDIYVNSTITGSPGYWLNSGPGGPNPGTYQGYLAGAKVTAGLCQGFHVGLNYIIIHTTSNGGTAADMAGLLVKCTGVTPCDGAVYTTPDSLPGSENGEGGPKGRFTGLRSVNMEKDALLQQNVPNPFAENTIINYNLPDKFNSAAIVIRDINGVLLHSIPVSKGDGGSVSLTKDDLVAGAYSYSLVIDNVVVESKKLIRE